MAYLAGWPCLKRDPWKSSAWGRSLPLWPGRCVLRTEALRVESARPDPLCTEPPVLRWSSAGLSRQQASTIQNHVIRTHLMAPARLAPVLDAGDAPLMIGFWLTSTASCIVRVHLAACGSTYASAQNDPGMIFDTAGANDKNNPSRSTGTSCEGAVRLLQKVY